MSKDWVEDIRNMHDHYGMTEKFKEMDQKTKMAFLLFRENFLKEEMAELNNAIGDADGTALKGNVTVGDYTRGTKGSRPTIKGAEKKPQGNIDKAEIVDALIDLCVVAIGTLDAFGVDAHKAWDEVLQANLNKEPGVKESRPNPFGLPDLIKPEDWEAPNHIENTGRL